MSSKGTTANPKKKEGTMANPKDISVLKAVPVDKTSSGPLQVMAIAEGEKECPPSNAKIVDAFINDLHESYFSSGKTDNNGDDYIITRKHNAKVTAYPSSFSNVDGPIHAYTKLTENIKYDNWWEQYIMDSWAIDDMFELINLQHYNHEYNCNNQESEKCKKHKKYRALVNTKNKIIHESEHTENINISKMLNNSDISKIPK